jgi:hypothetical protein
MNSADNHLRYRATEVLTRWLPKRPELRATLDAVAKTDSPPPVPSRPKP